MRAFVRCVEGRSGIYMLLGRYMRKVLTALVVAVTYEDTYYSLGLLLLINSVFIVIIAFYKPYKYILQDYFNLLGETILILILLFYSVLRNITYISTESRLALGWVGVVLEVLLLLQAFVQLIGLFVLFVMSRIG